MPVYAHCDNCQLDFQSESWELGGAVQSMHFAGNTDQCPRCGYAARIMDGRFDFDQYANPVIISGPQWSRDLVQRMQENLRRIDRVANAKRLTDEEARAKVEQLLAQIEADSPIVANEFRRRTEGKPRPVWSVTARAIAGVLAAIGAYNTVADFADRVTDVIRHLGG